MKSAFSHSEQGIPRAPFSNQTNDSKYSNHHAKTKSTSTCIPKLDLTKIKRDVEVENQSHGISEDMVIVDELKVEDYSEDDE